jgi:hypothetical protein
MLEHKNVPVVLSVKQVAVLGWILCKLIHFMVLVFFCNIIDTLFSGIGWLLCHSAISLLLDLNGIYHKEAGGPNMM